MAKQKAHAAEPSSTSSGPVRRVRATMLGYYNNIRRREGDVFTLDRAHDFSGRWMERVDAAVPEKITTGAQELRRKHDEELAGRAPASGRDSDPLN